VDVIVPPRDTIVDAATGKVVCTLPGEKVKKETTIPVMGTPDGYVCITFYGDTVIFKLHLTKEGVVKAEVVCKMGEQYRWRDPGQALVLHDKHLISTVDKAGVYELLTGKALYQFPKRGIHGGVGPILAGKYVVGFGDDCNHGDFRSREDECLMASFPIIDVSDATKPKVLGSGLLGGFNKPHVRHLEKWVPELNNKGWMPMVSRPAKAMWEMAGVPPTWGASCLAAQGNRLFIRSHSHLYCIGDPKVPYDWNPASRPKEVTEILTKTAK